MASGRTRIARFGPWGGALLLACFVAQGVAPAQELRPRRPLVGEVVRAAPIPPEMAAWAEHRLVVKFHDAARARSDAAGGLVSRSGADLSAAEAVARRHGVRFSQLIRRDEATIAAFEARAAALSGNAQPDLAGMLIAEVPGSTGPLLEEIGRAFQELAVVEFASISVLGPPPPADAAPPTPDLTGNQNYLDPDPGIDARYAWSLGLYGSGVRLSDCEYGWITDHEDLIDVGITEEPNQTPVPIVVTNGWDQHGTAALGVTSAPHNSPDYGVSGIAPLSQVYTYPEWTNQGGKRRVTAVFNALNDSSTGDVVLLEMQTANGAPAELDAPLWVTVRTGTDAGVVVVGAAGNGNVNLSFETAYLDRGDSGAILVGAGTADTNHGKISSSSFGANVDLQAWGDDVASTGYGPLPVAGEVCDLFLAAPNKQQYYTGCFKGTSSASAMVAGVACLVQERAKLVLGQPLPPRLLRCHLWETGKIPPFGYAWGPRFPDLRRAIDELVPGLFPKDELEAQLCRFAWEYTTLSNTFGNALAVQGQRVVVGAPGTDGFGVSFLFDEKQGYWVQTDGFLPELSDIETTGFGISVGSTAQSIVVGQYEHVFSDVLTCGGAVYLYEWDPAAGWNRRFFVGNQQSPLPTIYSVDIDGSLAVASGGDYPCPTSAGPGAVVFERLPTGWVHADDIVAPNIPAPIGPAIGWGEACAIEGTTIAVGAPRAGEEPGGQLGYDGLVVPYRHDGATWVMGSPLVAPDAADVYRMSFGTAIDIDDGVMFVGAPLSLTPTPGNLPAVYVFEGDGPTWSFAQKLQPGGLGYDDGFGRSVAVDGDYALVGAPWDDDAGPDAGAVYVYERSLGTWSLKEKRLAPDPGDTFFGRAVALSGDRAVAGAPGSDKAYVFSVTAVQGQPLSTSTGVVALTAGGTQDLLLDAGPAAGDELYWVLGSLSGTDPGTPIHGVVLPLVTPDPWFDFTVFHANEPPLSDTVGFLDASGRAQAGFALPPGMDPALAGLTLHHAFLAFDSTSLVFDYASNAVPLTLVP